MKKQIANLKRSKIKQIKIKRDQQQKKEAQLSVWYSEKENGYRCTKASSSTS